MKNRIIALLLTLVCVFTLFAALPAYAVEPETSPAPETTAAPAEPSEAPSVEPTADATAEPSAEPTTEPTAEPTATPEPTPTPAPTPWYTEAMDYAKAQGLLKGDDKGNMNPNKNATRAEVATILRRVFGVTQGKDITQFTDVSKTAWYYSEISAAADMGILLGDAAFTMRPNASITRQEAFALIARAFALPTGAAASLDVFSDASDVSAWAKPTLAGMVDAGLLKGDKGKLHPKAHVTRAEFAQVLYRLNIAFCDDPAALPASGMVVYSGPGPLDLSDFTGKLFLAGGSSMTLTGDAPEADVYVRMEPNAKVTLDGTAASVNLYTRGMTLTGSGKAALVDVRAVDCTVDLASDQVAESYDAGLSGVKTQQTDPVAALTPEKRSTTFSVTYSDMDTTGAANDQRTCTIHWWIDGVRQPDKTVTLKNPDVSQSFTVSDSVWKRDMPAAHTVKVQLLYGTDCITNTISVPVQNYTDAEYAQLAKNASYPYRVEVVKNKCTVLVYGLDKSGKYTILHKAFVCSPGQATPIGTFRTPSKMRWNPLMGGVWGQYCTQITGNFLFHSVYYRSTDPSTLYYDAYNQLGTICAHGCVRITVADAKWLYDNCPLGTTVQIYNSDTLPVAKPTAQKIPTNSPNRGWDPTDPDPRNPWKQ